MCTFIKPLLIENFTSSEKLLEKWKIIESAPNGISHKLDTKNSILTRYATPLKTFNSWHYMQLKKQLQSPFKIDFDLRIRQSGGRETKFTITNNLILKGCSRDLFAWYTWNNGFTKRGRSKVKPYGKWVHITQEVYDDHTNIYEDSELVVCLNYEKQKMHKIIFHVQHLDVNTHMELDISSIVCA